MTVKKIVGDILGFLLGVGLIIAGLYIGYLGWANLYVQTIIGATVVWLILALFGTVVACILCAIGIFIMISN